MAASTDPFGVDLSALDTASGAGSSSVPAESEQPSPDSPSSPAEGLRTQPGTAATESEPPASPLDSLTDQLRAPESLPSSEPAAPQPGSVPVPSPDSPNAQDRIHTGYGTVDAPRDGELSSITVTPDGVVQTANDLNGDGVVESVEVELADGNRVVYADTDLDGSFDTVRYESADFRTYQVESDADGDGQIDTVITFDEEYNATVSVGTDGDGMADESYTSADGIVDPA